MVVVTRVREPCKCLQLSVNLFCLIIVHSYLSLHFLKLANTPSSVSISSLQSVADNCYCFIMVPLNIWHLQITATVFYQRLVPFLFSPNMTSHFSDALVQRKKSFFYQTHEGPGIGICVKLHLSCCISSTYCRALLLTGVS